MFSVECFVEVQCILKARMRNPKKSTTCSLPYSERSSGSPTCVNSLLYIVESDGDTLFSHIFMFLIEFSLITHFMSTKTDLPEVPDISTVEEP